MLQEESIKQEDSVEVLFCKPFQKLPRVPMSNELSHMLIKLMLAKPLQNQELPDEEKPRLLLMIEKRLKYCFTYKINDQRLLLFLCILTETPGKAVMYLTYLQYWCKQNNVRELNLDTFCESIFPFGFPHDKEVSALWDDIKVELTFPRATCNLLDYQSAMKSIHF